MSIKVSIAMATYNGAKYLQEQLDSLAQQDYLPYELIACDDGSSDDTIDILEKFAKKAPFPVSIYRNESRLGYADNFLKAASLCRGDWVAFCDQDDVWLPNKLKDAVAAIEDYPNAVMILQNSYSVNYNNLGQDNIWNLEQQCKDKPCPATLQTLEQSWLGCMKEEKVRFTNWLAIVK